MLVPPDAPVGEGVAVGAMAEGVGVLVLLPGTREGVREGVGVLLLLPGMGSVLSLDSTNARTVVHSAALQPLGRKANEVAPLSMSGFTVQSGLPFAFAEIGAVVGKVMSLCIPAICAPPAASFTLIAAVVAPWATL